MENHQWVLFRDASFYTAFNPPKNLSSLNSWNPKTYSIRVKENYLLTNLYTKTRKSLAESIIKLKDKEQPH